MPEIFVLENQNQISLCIPVPESPSKPNGKKFHLHNFSLAPQSLQSSALYYPVRILLNKSVLFSFSFLSVQPAGRTGCEECRQAPVVGGFSRGGREGRRLSPAVPAADPRLARSPRLSPGCHLQLPGAARAPGPAAQSAIHGSQTIARG